MTANEAWAEISRVASGLLNAGLAIAVNTPVVSRTGSTARISWPASSAQPGLLTELSFASIFEYRRFLFGGHYICLMIDGALLQISIDLKNETIVGHRMCYYPCPVLLPAGFEIMDADDLDLLLFEELHSHIEAIESQQEPPTVTLRLRSPIRFDYAPDLATETESSCHAHISSPDVRIPVYAPLSVGHFIRFVLRHFYPEAWLNRDLDNVTRWPFRHFNRCVSLNDELELHFNCRDTTGNIQF